MSDEQSGAAPVALTPEVVAFLQREGVEVAAAAGAVLVRRGESGVASGPSSKARSRCGSPAKTACTCR